MITAVDTNVLLDVFGADPAYGPASRAALQRSLDEGALIACDVVWAEVGAFFPSPGAAAEAMGTLGANYSPLSQVAALGAAEAWRAYREQGGPRARVVADFLIGAHARAQADRLLTRDRGFYRSCFVALKVVDPAPT